MGFEDDLTKFVYPLLFSDYSDSSQNSRGFYPSSNGTARGGGRQGSSRTLAEPDSHDKRPRIPFSRPSMQAAPPQLPKASSASGQEGHPAPCQPFNRKARNIKPLDLQSPALSGASLQEDPEYSSLIGAMDNDLDRPESLATEALQDQSSRPLQSKGYPPLIVVVKWVEWL